MCFLPPVQVALARPSVSVRASLQSSSGTPPSRLSGIYSRLSGLKLHPPLGDAVTRQKATIALTAQVCGI